MRPSRFLGLLAVGWSVLFTTFAQAEILAMPNYESKPEQTTRKEGLAILDVDPKSQAFGKILMDIPLPSDLASCLLQSRSEQGVYYGSW